VTAPPLVVAHLEEVARRWRHSRYDDLVAEVARTFPVASRVAAAVAGTPPPATVVRAVDASAARTDAVRQHPAVTLRLARRAGDHEQAAVVLSAALGADLDVVRRVLGPNLAHVDGAPRLLAARGHQAVGTVVLAFTERGGDLVAGLHALAVAPRWRGRGTGLALAARAVELAAGAGAEVVCAEGWPGADRLLDRLGFRPV
jgi:GNAT superfamily N-acetyltransferase